MSGVYPIQCDECQRFTSEKSGGDILVSYETGELCSVACRDCKTDWAAVADAMNQENDNRSQP